MRAIQDLATLQDLIKRDPAAWKNELMAQQSHFESQLAIFKLKPSEEDSSFEKTITFFGHVAPLFRTLCAKFPSQLYELLSQNYNVMAPSFRRACIQSLVLLRNKGMFGSVELLELCFKLFRCKDKMLRDMLFKFIVSDIKNAKDVRLNRSLQSYVFKISDDVSEIAAAKALQVAIHLYKKNVWNDAKTVNAIALCCFAKIPKLLAIALDFFLNVNEIKPEDDSDDDAVQPDLKKIRRASKITKNSKSKRRLERAKKILNKEKPQAEHFNFSALHLINDPQGFSERLFNRLRAASENFELRLQMMSLISRLVGIHKLLLPDFYPYLQRFLFPHQKDVTRILAYAAQASHDLVPPDNLRPIVMTIANAFVAPHCASEVLVVGLNAIREICARGPLDVMDEALLKDLVLNKKCKEKGVMMAARSLIGFFRENNPTLLEKKDRGRVASENIRTFRAREYGESRPATGIDGEELLLNVDDGPKGGEDQASESDNSSGEVIGDVCLDDEDEECGSDEDDLDAGDEDDEFLEEDFDSEEGTSGEDDPSDDNPALLAADQNPSDTGVPSQTNANGPVTKLSLTRILTDDDFRQIRAKKARILLGDKESDAEDAGSDDDQQTKEFLDESDLRVNIKRTRADYDERMASIMQGREGRQFGRKKHKKGGSTNKEKLKTKNFIMLLQKSKFKSRASMNEKQKSRKKKRLPK